MFFNIFLPFPFILTIKPLNKAGFPLGKPHVLHQHLWLVGVIEFV
jgi:hypothetical protein